MGNLKHGHSPFKNQTRTYAVWVSMRQRCSNKNNGSYDTYGSRGISVCAEWSDFSQFLSDMGERPANMSLDRIDNDGPYSKENCRWSNPKEQARNRSTNIFVDVNGERLILKDAVSKYSTHNYFCVLHRVNRGWDAHRALFEPKIPANKRWISTKESRPKTCLEGK